MGELSSNTRARSRATDRARERKAAQLIEDVLGRYLGTVADPAAAVTLIDRELQDLADAEVRETPHYRNFRHNLSLALKEAHASTTKGADASTFLITRLQALQTRNRSVRIAGDTHSIRR